jgi:hypothetical protein
MNTRYRAAKISHDYIYGLLGFASLGTMSIDTDYNKISKEVFMQTVHVNLLTNFPRGSDIHVYCIVEIAGLLETVSVDKTACGQRAGDAPVSREGRGKGDRGKPG